MSKSLLSTLVISLLILGCGPNTKHSPRNLQPANQADPGSLENEPGDNGHDQNGQRPDDNEPENNEPEEPNRGENPPNREETPNRDNAPANDCKGLEDAIYVIDKDQEAIYYYNTRESEFNHVGDLDCGVHAGQPASMSIARDGFAYVRYYDDTLYAVNLDTMECNETTYETDFGHFGMGFAAINPNTWQDELFVANRRHLARLNVNTWQLDNVGTLPSQSELTGNRLGQLWAILPLESPARVVQLNKETAQVERSINLNGFPSAFTIDTFAFANWGGDFFIFVRQNGMGESTTVYRVTGDGDMLVDLADTDMNIVGAGVSTCATAAR